MRLFHHDVHFSNQDPLDDGLGDDISAERNEADAFGTLEDISSDELVKHWSTIVKDIEKDPDWFTFDND